MKRILPIALLLLTLIVLYSSYFIVDETKQVIITRLGKSVRQPITSAGIYYKVPIIDTANYFDKRILEWDGDTSNPIPTKDNKNVIVDATARWRIVDPLKFMQSIGNEYAAQSRLDDIIDSNVRDVISKHDLIELVRNSNRVVDSLKPDANITPQDQDIVTMRIEIGREKTTREILKKSKPIIETYGIELIDVRIKGLMYSPSVLASVYNSMISHYDNRAQNLRSEGDKRKSEIEGETEFEVKKISSGAYKTAQQLRGEGDAKAAQIYADALKVDPDFYHFQKSLEAYEETIQGNTTVILGTDSELYRVLKSGQ